MSSNKTLKYKGQELHYAFRPHPLSRSLRVSIRSDGKVLVTAPRSCSLKRVEAFVLDKADWILEKQRAIIAHREAKPRLTGEADYARRKAAARHLILKRIKELNRVYGFSYGRISIRNQRSRWGSCSAEGNLSFNYRLVYLPEPLIDYVIVHELCHLKEMNHGVAFWRLLAKSIPDYALRKRDLKAQGLELF